MKRPTEDEFVVKPHEAFVTVRFKPTDSHYTFNRLADREDIARHGPLSPDVRVRHGATGDTGEYPSDAVLAMARRLAETSATPRK